jgi:hypothetical protein
MLVDSRTPIFRAGPGKNKVRRSHPRGAHYCLAGSRLDCNRLLLLSRILAAGNRSERGLECVAKQGSRSSLSGGGRTHDKQLSPALFLSPPCFRITGRGGSIRGQSHIPFRFACSHISFVPLDRYSRSHTIGGGHRSDLVSGHSRGSLHRLCRDERSSSSWPGRDGRRLHLVYRKGEQRKGDRTGGSLDDPGGLHQAQPHRHPGVGSHLAGLRQAARGRAGRSFRSSGVRSRIDC